MRRVPTYEYPKNSVPEYLSILVPNVDNVRTDFLIGTIMKQVKFLSGNDCSLKYSFVKFLFVQSIFFTLIF